MNHEVYVDGVEYVPKKKFAGGAKPLPEGYVSPHFRASEFACNHCGALPGGVDQELLDCLEKMRADLGGHPVTITSGYRCRTHNTNVGSSEASMHRKNPCQAADHQVKNVSPDTVHAYWVDTYPDQYGIGRYGSFTHFDVRPNRARW